MVSQTWRLLRRPKIDSVLPKALETWQCLRKSIWRKIASRNFRFVSWFPVCLSVIRYLHNTIQIVHAQAIVNTPALQELALGKNKIDQLLVEANLQNYPSLKKLHFQKNDVSGYWHAIHMRCNLFLSWWTTYHQAMVGNVLQAFLSPLSYYLRQQACPGGITGGFQFWWNFSTWKN